MGVNGDEVSEPDWVLAVCPQLASWQKLRESARRPTRDYFVSQIRASGLLWELMKYVEQLSKGGKKKSCKSESPFEKKKKLLWEDWLALLTLKKLERAPSPSSPERHYTQVQPKTEQSEKNNNKYNSKVSVKQLD